MKLLNYTSTYFAIILFIIITAWAGIFYFSMLDEIYDSIDDGLDNQKGLVIQKASIDSSVLLKSDFDETYYAIREIAAQEAVDFQDVYSDTMMYMQNEKSDEPVRLLTTTFLQNGKYYQLQVATSMVEEDDLIKQLFWSVAWLYLGLVVTIILFNNVLLKKVWHPFYHLMKQLKRFRLDQPVPVTRSKTKVDEFKLLDETVQKLVKRNVEIYNSQKAFIENAAHELQTPLAISINKLETLADSNGLSGQQLALLASTLDHLERLAGLNKSLLLLSRIENRQFADETTIDISALAKRIAGDFADQSQYNGLQIDITTRENCFQTLNSDLATVLVTNLVKNAITHNKPAGFVHIITGKDSLTVENSGPDAPLDAQHIFTRFYRNASSAASTGLGLAIVKAIADLYGFTVQYDYNMKHIMVVHF